jgi:hypothetical protein
MILARKANHTTKDLELDKFDTNQAGETIIRTSAEGTFTPTGLKTAIKITGTTVSTSATPLPATAQIGRNSLSIQNKSSTQTLYVGPSNVTADNDPSKGGWEVPPLSNVNFDITEDVILYGVFPTTPELVKVLEIS